MIEICTFGGLVIYKNRKIVCKDLGRVTGELLTCLAIHANEVVRRERIAEMIWPCKSASRSRAALNTSLWRINDSLKDAGIHRHVAIDRVNENTISLKTDSVVDVDCNALSSSVAACERSHSRGGELSNKERSDLRLALVGYRDGFLDGTDSEWVIRAREKYRCLHARGMTILMRNYALSGRIEEALDCGRSILEQDEFRETTQRAVMWLHVMNGQRGEAIAQYQRLKNRLIDEIGVEPMADTTSLYQHIVEEAKTLEQPGSRIASAIRAPSSISDRLRAYGESRASVFETILRSEMNLH